MSGYIRPPLTNCIYCNQSGNCNHAAKRKKLLGLIPYKPTCSNNNCQYRVEQYIKPAPLPKVTTGRIQCSSAGYISAPTQSATQTDETILYVATGAAIASAINNDDYGGGSSSGGGSSRSWESDSTDYSCSDCGSFSSD